MMIEPAEKENPGGWPGLQKGLIVDAENDDDQQEP
jgi:hypothetical protein